MSIGMTIKKLRRERDITQEQLAEYLGISSRAVSQWECDRTAPDISQLPLLANIFEVSADVLLGIDIMAKNKKIDNIVEEAKAKWSKGYYAEGAITLRAGLKEFPNNYKMMFDLMACIWRVRDEPQNLSEREMMTKEVIELGEKILEYCSDTEIRNSAVQLLCFTYPEIGEKDKAIAIAEKMPNRYLTKNKLLSIIYQGTKRFEQQRDNLFESFENLYSEMLFNNAPLDDNRYPYTNKEMVLIYNKYLSIMDIVFEDKNYGFIRQSIGWANINLAKLYMREGNSNAAIECLKIAADHSVKQDTEYDPNKKYTCLLFKGKTFGGVLHNIENNDSLHQLEEMNDNVFDSIRLNSIFIEIENRLKEHASKH